MPGFSCLALAAIHQTVIYVTSVFDLRLQLHDSQGRKSAEGKGEGSMHRRKLLTHAFDVFVLLFGSLIGMPFILIFFSPFIGQS